VLPRSHPPSAIDGNPEVSRFNFYLFFCLFVFRSLFLGSMDRLGLIVGCEPFVCLFVCLFVFSHQVSRARNSDMKEK